MAYYWGVWKGACVLGVSHVTLARRGEICGVGMADEFDPERERGWKGVLGAGMQVRE